MQELSQRRTAGQCFDADRPGLIPIIFYFHVGGNGGQLIHQHLFFLPLWNKAIQPAGMLKVGVNNNMKGSRR
jgi:hypothetical protein